MLNLALVDTTKHRKAVISKMQAPTDEQAQKSTKSGDFILYNEALFFSLSDKDNSNTSQKNSLSLENFGAVMEQTKYGAFEITFEGHKKGLKRSKAPKPLRQISLAVSKALNSTSDSGKKQIIINLQEHALGAVKVEIWSQMGHNGISKIKTIKISANKYKL